MMQDDDLIEITLHYLGVEESLRRAFPDAVWFRSWGYSFKNLFKLDVAVGWPYEDKGFAPGSRLIRASVLLSLKAEITEPRDVVNYVKRRVAAAIYLLRKQDECVVVT